jgi:hypothetical protein
MQLRAKEFRATILFAAALTLALGVAGVQAAEKTLTPQQQRMSDCNKQATGKKGDERKSFMSTCLKGESSGEVHTQTQQEKMKSCNADAKTKSLKGDERKSFMSTCLSGPAAHPAH